MNWIVALIAFAGVMAVLSTITTVIVETLHKGLSLRSGGLMRMLRTVHISTIEQLGDDGLRTVRGAEKKRVKQSANQFAREMVAMPTKRNTWWDRVLLHTPILSRFARRFERLSKLQLVEQLAQTEFGRQLADKDRATIERNLAMLGYQFDRYGVAQSAIFKMRARFLSAIAGLAFVVVANINAVQIYRYLASDEEVLRSSFDFLGLTSEEAGGANLEGQLAALNTTLQQFAEETEAATEAQLAAAKGEAIELRSFLVNLQDQIDGLDAAGLPIGRYYFPYCEPRDDGVVRGAEPALSNAPYCKEAVPLFGAENTAMNRMLLTGSGWVWMMYIIGSAGLLGLGAPFWFNLFRSVAQATGRINVPAPAAKTDEGAKAKVREGYERRSLARPSDEPPLEVLTDAFLISAGQLDRARIGEEIALEAGEAVAGAVFDTKAAPRAATGAAGQPGAAPQERNPTGGQTAGIRTLGSKDRP